MKKKILPAYVPAYLPLFFWACNHKYIYYFFGPYRQFNNWTRAGIILNSTKILRSCTLFENKIDMNNNRDIEPKARHSTTVRDLEQ